MLDCCIQYPRGRWMVSLKAWPLYLQGKGTWYPLKRRLCGHQILSGPIDITMVLISARWLKHTNFKDKKCCTYAEGTTCGFEKQSEYHSINIIHQVTLRHPAGPPVYFIDCQKVTLLDISAYVQSTHYHSWKKCQKYLHDTAKNKLLKNLP